MIITINHKLTTDRVFFYFPSPHLQYTVTYRHDTLNDLTNQT